MTSDISETRFSKFDNMGRLLEMEQITPFQNETIAEAIPRVSKFKFNISGGLIERTYPSGRVVRNFTKSDGSLDKIVSHSKTYVSNISYTPSGGKEKLKLGNGRWESAEFNSRLQVTQFGLGTTETTRDLWKVDYEYGELQADGTTVDSNQNTGNVAKQTIDFQGLQDPFVQTYKYDELYRLIEAKETENTTINWSQSFGYDLYGNRTSILEDIDGLINNQTPMIDTATNRYSSGEGFSYDKNGNITQDTLANNQIRQFVFDGNNRQKEVLDANGKKIGKYYYDGEGKRVKKKVYDAQEQVTEETIFVYSGGTLVAEYTSKPPAPNPTVNYLTADRLDSPRVITDDDGIVVSRRDFMPFGKEISAGVGSRSLGDNYGLVVDGVRQKFTGYMRDEETGLDFAEARMYDSSNGRFTAVDPLLASGKSANPQTFNRYVYTGNNPILRIDKNGLEWWIVASDGGTTLTPVWSLTKPKVKKGERVTGKWTEYLYKCEKKCGGTVWVALNPNKNEVYTSAERNRAWLKLGIYTEFQGQLDDVVDEFFSGQTLSGWGVVRLVLPAKDIGFLVAYIKTGDFNNAAIMFVKIAGMTAAGGYIAKAVLKAIGVVGAKILQKLGTKALHSFQEALIRNGGAKLAAALCCFTAGTTILTINGPVPVERIKIGDKVLSYNEKTQGYEFKAVVKTFIGVKENIFRIKIKGEKQLTTTGDHPFYVRSRHKARDGLKGDDVGEWITADKLRAGMRLLRSESKWVRITSVVADSKPKKVYNFEVEGNHNYLVGDIGVLSHNCDFLSKLSGGETTKQIFKDALAIFSKKQDPKLSKFQNAQAALSEALGKLTNPSNQLYPLGDIGGNVVRGYAAGGQGLVEIEGVIFVVQRTTAKEGGGWNFEILGEFVSD